MSFERSEIIDQLTQHLARIRALMKAVDVPVGLEKIRAIEERMAQPGFWDNNEKAQETIAELKRLRGEIEPLVETEQSIDDTLELARLAATEGDNESFEEIASETRRLGKRLDMLELRATLNGKHDPDGAFLSVHAGAGGTESCDWAAMLARMYKRFCERQGFKVSIVDTLDGEEAGIRSITYELEGHYAYGYLRSEIGVHRLVRKSPFDAKNRRHTSFAAVDVIPDIPEADREIDISPADLRVDTFRSSGAGGQHVNVTDSAVRITHKPTGIVVQCQNERSQHANRNTAMKMLKAKLIHLEEAKREEELEKLYGEKGEIAWANQIRNYVLEPYKLVKDRRTNHEAGNVDAVLDGELMPFIEAYLRWKRMEKKT